MAKIVNLSEAASIGLHAIILIAKSKEPLNVIKIAERTESSKHHVAKVLQRLVKENYLRSQRGPAGGFLLNKKPEEINLLEIYESIEGKHEMRKCPLGKQICPFDKCIINNITNKMTQEFTEYLQSQRLDSYL